MFLHLHSCHRYYTPRPLFESTDHGEGFMCTLALPSSYVLPPLRGPKPKTMKKAQQLVCVDACKKLHRLGVLDDFLCPSVENPLPGISIKTTAAHSSSDGVGT